MATFSSGMTLDKLGGEEAVCSLEHLFINKQEIIYAGEVPFLCGD